MKIVIGITGATGAIYGIRLMEAIKSLSEAEVHLIVSSFGMKTIQIETQLSHVQIEKLADYMYSNDDLGALLASGSFCLDAMIIIPCSMKTLSAISNGLSDTLIARCADVCIKEGRKLVLCPRETPLSAIHLENMLKLSRLGVGMIPPMPAFYNNPDSLEDIINHHTMKVLDYIGIDNKWSFRWGG